MQNIDNGQQIVWKESHVLWILALLFSFLLLYVFYDSLKFMEQVWKIKEEYGHGYIIPFITLFLIWQKKDQLEKMEFSGSWLGPGVLALGLFLYYAGELSSIYTVVQYAFLISLMGIVLSALGQRAFKVILVPLVILVFMIPLPNFLLFNLSSQLQLISSEIGVAVIRLFGISVFLEGNVIDLGVYKLQVVEACSGLNYLFPLMTLGFITAYFFTGAFWKKAVIFLSTIPITVFMNSFRIGAIGVTVEYWGPEMAEGFLHDFEGWAVFMSCIAILVLEMWLLSMIGKDRLPLREAFGLDFPEPTPEDAKIQYRPVPTPLYASFGLLLVAAITAAVMPAKNEIRPDRKEFMDFPMTFDGWQGKRDYLEQIYIDALKFTDYMVINYVDDQGGIVNLYSAYYASQKKGASAHSPRSCIPGGGWRITSIGDHQINGTNIGGVPMHVNRLLIEKDGVKQLVYYWFQQRGRIVTNEYLMKWYLFLDSMNRSRTDGALIRLTTILEPGRDIAIADDRLEDFSKKIAPIIPEYVPD